MDRIAALRKIAFEKKNFDGFFIFNEANLQYFTGFPGASCLLVAKDVENTAYAYGTNYEQAKAEGKGLRVELVKRGERLFQKAATRIKDSRIKKLAVDSVSYESYRLLAKELRGSTRLRMGNKLIWELRKVKDPGELELMRKAGELTSRGMKAAYEFIRPGVREFEVAGEIEYAMRKGGGWGTAFDTIVASGVRSAFPHGGCTDKQIREGDLVVVDIGAIYQFYRSDMTRTIVGGKASEKQKKIYEVVKQAQEKAHEAIKPKVRAREVDAAARKVIVEAGYGEYFVHSLGHGVGLEVHEMPVAGPESKDRLAVGNVITNEPGIYIVGFGGFRIEDTVLVRERKPEKFTVGPYTLEAEK